jgi:sigma-B regulation protein RsbU (phosphoserine phosphatase)
MPVPASSQGRIARTLLDTVKTLKQVFGDLSPQELEALAAVAVSRYYPSRTVVCREGELEHVFYIIQDGQVSIAQRLPGGDERTLGVQGPGSFFGELGLLENRPRSATVRTLTASHLLEITEVDFEQMVNRSPEAALTVLRGVIRSLRETDRVTISHLQAKNVELEQAYADLKAAQAELVEQERLKRELEIAAEVQRSILPTEFPSIPGFEFAAYAQPAREVGGDYYDVLLLDGDHFGVVMADASGKSVNAALYMAVTRALFLAKAAEYRSPCDAAFRIHELLMTSSDSDMFVTAFYGVVNPQAREMRYVRAGHDWPIFYRPQTGQLSLLQVQGRFLGSLEGLVLNEASLQFSPGDVLVCYSDGLTDATASDENRYGLERLKAVVTRAGHGSARSLVEAIIADVDLFRAGYPQPDDLTLLVMKVQ